jgi:NAD(P)-dependent dehydrogenase (short-subunit alcohol dehydrogenase family)
MMAPMSAIRPTAVVTGASRGIGKACAIALAEAGFDLAITARTVRRGDVVSDPDGLISEPLPGSLEETAEAVVEAGGHAHMVPLDLLDRGRLVPAAEQALAALGHVDVLVNNAIYVGAGNYDRFLAADIDGIEDRIFGNVTAQLRFMRPIVASMVDRGSGLVLDMTSAAGYLKPWAPPDDGGWSLAYSVSKAGFHRIAPQLSFEYGDRGLVALNVQPGMVATERVRLVQGPVARIATEGVEPAVIGAALAHVATHAGTFDPSATVQLQDVARSLGLLPAP